MSDILFHSEPVEKVLKKLSSKIDGLSYEEAKTRLHDFNSLKFRTNKTNFLEILSSLSRFS